MLAKGSLFSRIINRLWVTTKHVPLQTIKELHIDLKRPIIYVVEQNNASDLLGLQASCKQAGLPDPYLPININGEQLSALIFIHNWSFFSPKAPQFQDAPYLAQYQQLLDLHQADQALDIQLIPVTFYWGRNPGREGKKSFFDLTEQGQVGLFHKSLIVLKNGKDHLVRFNKPISIKKLSSQGDRQQLAHKLAKVAMRYFGFQKRSSIGPKLPNRTEMIESVLAQPALRRIIQEACQNSEQTEAQIEAQCREHLKEISANFSYSFLRFFRFILKGIWNKIYSGIEVHHAQAVRQACQSGAEIIYMPCHRSHMDYLLLSYLLFEQGLVPPHVAAGVNLNFFPAGPVFRRSGAFFLRRTFKDSPLYGAVFNAYFSMLFKQGYPIEFFTEGGRSRTGLLLEPKTGLLSASLNTYLKQPQRNVVIIPIYIGYDHIMEVSTYIKEQAGHKKERENIWQVLGIIKKLGNFGRAFVNFGEPINVKQYFDKSLPNWRNEGVSEDQLKNQVNLIAQKVMVHINEATAVNALPLCAAILLANKTQKICQKLFLVQLRWHQQWFSLNDMSSLITYQRSDANSVLKQALAQQKFDMIDNMVCCSESQALILDYYRNNIVHLFVLPSLVCHSMDALIQQQKTPTLEKLLEYALSQLTILQKKYYLNQDSNQNEILIATINKLLKLKVLVVNNHIYEVLDKPLLMVLQGHIDNPFDKPVLAT